MDGPDDKVSEPRAERGATAGGSFSLPSRIALWSAALLALTATFLAYDQFALALQWVVMKLC